MCCSSLLMPLFDLTKIPNVIDLKYTKKNVKWIEKGVCFYYSGINKWSHFFELISDHSYATITQIKFGIKLFLC